MTSPKRFSWEFRLDRLREHLDKDGGIENMLTWSTVHEALYSGWRSPHSDIELEMVRQEYRFLCKEPELGNPPNLKDGMSGTAIRQALVTQTIFDNEEYPKTIFEFGGGYGSLARSVLSVDDSIEYYIYDFELMHELQAEYLHRLGYYPWFVRQATYADVFVSVCGIDEAPIEMRREILSCNYNLYVIVYHDNFYGVDNKKYFESVFPNMALTELQEVNMLVASSIDKTKV